MQIPKETIRAFPATPEQLGMELRDWFAGQAISFVMRQVVKSEELEALMGHVMLTDEDTFKKVAKVSYQMADAMIQVRQIR